MDDMFSQSHLLRITDKVINWNFGYNFTAEKHTLDNGHSSAEYVMLTKILFIQYLRGIKSMCLIVKKSEANMAYY